MTELVYFVDENDTPTGEVSEKYAAHTATTKLHAAFSVYVFNKSGQLLVTQRAFTKKVWPGVWTNTCCGHPMPSESREDAIVRRMQHELGMKVQNIQLVLPHYTYTTPPYNGIIENEYCPVFVATAASEPRPNAQEVEAFHWIEWDDYVKACESDGSSDIAKRDWMQKIDTGESRKLGIWSWWAKDQLKLLQHSEAFHIYRKNLL